MTLTPGTRLGAYDITAQIGEGGMGHVFRATDTKLKRQVAIKVLPPSLAADHDRLARFQREAEVLASLNHPHIAGIYGLEESEGVSALVMELVDGEDLSQRIARGALPMDEALPIAQQIAEALEAAHEQGIIHRDLKPANIRVRPDGTVKVLDFGLAKAIEPVAAASASAAMSPTVSLHATQAGMILGTAAYMAPEQARGRFIDKRADIWAFGAVLYEMLTGTPAFGAEDVSMTLSKVLQREPDFDRLPASLPARVTQVLRLCLRKDPKQRAGDIRDVRLALEGAFETIAVAAPRSVVARALPALTAVLAALVVALGLALWASRRVEKPVDRPLVRLDVDLGADAAFPLPSANNPGVGSMAISADGTRLVFLSGTPPRLFSRRLDQPKATELPGTQGADAPFFSPDGQWVGFWVNGKVNKISVEGGAVVPLGEVGSFGGASWAEDGSIVVSDVFGKGLLQVPAAGGSPTVVAPREAGLVVPRVLPGGKAILSAACAAGGADNCNIEVVTVADRRRRILARAGHSPHYLPSSNGNGHLVYLNKATLFAIPFDLATLDTRGTAVPVLDDVAYAAPTGAGLFDVSRTGTLIYRRSRVDAAAMMTVQWVDSSGRKEPLRDKPTSYGSSNPQLSPDGKRIALVITEGGHQDVWVYDRQRDTITRLTFGGINHAPAWSPDGQYVVFAKLVRGIFQARADGASQPQALTASQTTQVPVSFTPDGKRLAYMETGPRRQARRGVGPRSHRPSPQARACDRHAPELL